MADNTRKDQNPNQPPMNKPGQPGQQNPQKGGADLDKGNINKPDKPDIGGGNFDKKDKDRVGQPGGGNKLDKNVADESDMDIDENDENDENDEINEDEKITQRNPTPGTPRE
jgi:hypothetical protein